jgi:hypothetical protein
MEERIMSSTSDIAAKWLSLKTRGLDLGAPSAPEADTVGSGRVQAYQNGRIYWHAQIGTHEVHGAILAKYLKLGGPATHPVTGRRELGFPRSDEKQTPDGFARVSEFEWGAIYSGYDAGAVPLYGPIYQEWATKFPLASVVEGYPLIEPFTLAGGQAAIFSNGFSFTFGPQHAVFAGHYHGPMPGKPDIVTPDTRDIAAFNISFSAEVWQTIQQQRPNLLTEIWKDRLVLQRVDNPRSLIPLVVELEGAQGSAIGGTSGGSVFTGPILTSVVQTVQTNMIAPADPVIRDHRGQPPQGAPGAPPVAPGAVVRDHRPDVALRLNVRLAPGALMVDRSLYNIAVKTPNGSAAAIGLHAIYAKKVWQNFGILHVTDIHVTGRADAIYATLRERGRNESAEAFNNTNDGFRDFIRYANHLHARGLVDLIVATGDLVDYQFEGDGNTPNDLGGSFLLFEHLLRGWSRSPKGTPVEELRVPIFTTLGNHDYRKIPYGLLVDIDIPFHSDREVASYESFNLTKADVEALQGDKPTISSDEALAQVHVNRPNHYFKRINTTDADGGSSYLVRLGPSHRVVILDSKYDIGILEGTGDAILVNVLGYGSEDKKSFVDGAPNQVGVSDTHLSLMSQALAEAGSAGVVITGIHGPPINIQGAQFAPYFRETEHPFADKKDIITYLLRQAPGDFVGTFGTLGGDFSVNAVPITSINWDGAEARARDSHPGWMTSLGHPFFMSGPVDDLLDRDVSKGRMDDFLKLCAGVSVPGANATRPVDLVLCGHGHNHVEYRVQWDTAGNRMRYFMDFYTENPSEYYATHKGSFDFGNRRVGVLIRSGAPIPGTPENNIQDPQWDGEELTLRTQPFGDPLNSAHDKAAWWAQRRPLLIETAALGPIGSGSNDRFEPGKRKPNPIFQGFRVISVKGKNIASIRNVTLRELRANNFKLPWEDTEITSPGSTTGPIGTPGPVVTRG